MERFWKGLAPHLKFKATEWLMLGWATFAITHDARVESQGWAYFAWFPNWIESLR